MKVFHLAILISLSTILSCQSVTDTKLAAHKTALFSAVQWEGATPLVQIDKDWYYLESMNGMTLDQILTQLKTYDIGEWKKRFSDDMAEAYQELGTPLPQNVALSVKNKKSGQSKNIHLDFTKENRNAAVTYRRANSSKKFAPTDQLTKAQAKEDLEFLKLCLNLKYSYFFLNGHDYNAQINQVVAALPATISAKELANKIQSIIAPFGDGHSGISGFTSRMDRKFIDLRFKKNRDDWIVLNSERKLVDPNFYRLKKINGQPISKIFEAMDSFIKKGSPSLIRTAREYHLRIPELYLSPKEAVAEVRLELANSKGKTKTIKATPQAGKSNSRAKPKILIEQKILENNIGYLRIPSMSPSEKDIANRLKEVMQAVKGTEALIIDVRDNSGGKRAILNGFAAYLVAPDDSPIVVNAAKFRTDDKTFKPNGYLSSRYLYPFESDKLNDKDRTAIDEFNETFEPKIKIPEGKFSQWHYILLRSGSEFHYSKPVYILMNENCYSATDIFCSALGNLSKVQLAGTLTGGGSGKTESYNLPNSSLSCRLSSMISFQTNGKLFDGNGVEPDLPLEVSISDFKHGTDSQLDQLVAIITK